MTLPKLMVDGLKASCPATVPVPVSATEVGEFDAVELIESVPVAAPAEVGANVTLKVRL